MFEHGTAGAVAPTRVVILGARGFVGAATERALVARGIPVRALGRGEVDLLAADAATRLAGALRPDDSLVVISARAPVKDVAMLGENVRMMEAVCRALSSTMPQHVVYVSSDAVYRDSAQPLSEESCAEPASLHGAMHLVREVMLKSTVRAPLAILRPTLIYGAADPHNGYGPNRFRRLAAAGKEIVLFGEGEERRDHVLVDDVADLILRALMRRSRGTLNAATGEVVSFRDIAEQIARLAAPPVAVRGSPRVGPMPHGGYRAFDPAGTRQAFPDFRYMRPSEGFARIGLRAD